MWFESRVLLKAFKAEDAAVSARLKELADADLSEGTEEALSAAREQLALCQKEFWFFVLPSQLNMV